MEPQYGFERTVCACAECSIYCRYMPGAFSPLDIEQWHAKLGEAFSTWLMEHVRASSGAQAIIGGKVMQIPSLVPARQANGKACHWLGSDGKCTMHENSPFGCAFYDSHIGAQEGEQRSLARIRDIISGNERGEFYRDLWRILWEMGLRAPGPRQSLEVMRRETQDPKRAEA